MSEAGLPEPNAQQHESDWEYLAVGAVLIAGIVLVLIFVGVSQSDYEIKDLGPVGDWFGGLLNPLIAFLALTGLVKSVSIQRRALKHSADGLREQLTLQRHQASKQTFFDLLKLRADTVETVEWELDGATVKGRAAIKAILKTLAATSNELSDDDIQEELDRWEVPKQVPAHAKPYVALFAAFYSNDPTSFGTAFHQAILQGEGKLGDLEAELGHVFRSTYQVLKFVYKCTDFSVTEKQDLVNYLRAQMSEGEFALFALTATTYIGEKSRAVSIAFDFYEDRLFSIPWARELAQLFDPNDPGNAAFAARLDYPPLQSS